MLTRMSVLAFSVWLALLPRAAHAQGFGIYEQGACVMSRGGAGVAEPCGDGSAIYVNPAGLATGKGIAVSGGATFIFGSGTFTSDAGASTALKIGKGVPPPHGYMRYGINDKVTLGIGAYVPYGLSISWPLDFAGRFISYDSTLQTVYVQPTLAYAITPGVSIGAGVTIARSSVTLNRREDLAQVPLPVAGLTFGALVGNQTDFENTSLSASGAMGAGANVGLIVKANDQLRFGVRYLTHVKLHYNGTATFTPIAANYVVTKPNLLGLPVGTPLGASVALAQASLQNQSVSTDLEMPAQFVAGMSVKANPRLTLFADYQWIQWSAFATITLDFSKSVPPEEQLPQNYRDTSAVRLGVQYEVSPGLRLSAGYFHNQAAAPDESVTPLLPDATRNHFTGGLGWSPLRKWTIDLAYQFVRYDDRQGRVVNPPPGEAPTVALNSGVYRSRGDLFGITTTFRP
jgi:long-chain fatty acid transport protein